MNTRTHLTTAALALVGAGTWYVAGNALSEAGRLENQPNPLGLKRSPYGQVLAMAIQTPIDGDWHGGLEIHDHGPEGHSHDHHGHHDHDHGHSHGPQDLHGLVHADHGEEEHPADDHGNDAPAPVQKDDLPFLSRLEYAVSKRNNPNPPTPGHQWYLRREIEKKLRFAYELDPSHYANYNSYNLFLTQDALGTEALSRDGVRKRVFALADHTVRYCLRETSDSRPALTAASAAYNSLEQMLLAEPGTYPISRMHEQLKLIELCIQRHVELLNLSLENRQFELLSPQRQAEVLDRSRFAMKLHESAAKAIERREANLHSTASHPGS